jgi:hypothetical protein
LVGFLFCFGNYQTLASTSDEDEMTHLNEAAAKLRSIVHLINERTRQVERVEQLLTVQSKIEHGEVCFFFSNICL